MDFFWLLLFVTFCFLRHQTRGSRNLNQQKVPTASSNNFPLRKETDIAHHKTICSQIDEGYVENQNRKSLMIVQCLHLLVHRS